MKIYFLIVLLALVLVVFAVQTNGIRPAEDQVNGSQDGTGGDRRFPCDSKAPETSCIRWPEGRQCKCGSACYSGICRCQQCV